MDRSVKHCRICIYVPEKAGSCDVSFSDGAHRTTKQKAYRTLLKQDLVQENTYKMMDPITVPAPVAAKIRRFGMQGIPSQ